MHPDRFPKVAEQLRAIGLDKWKVIEPPTEIRGRRSTNRAFAFMKIWGSLEIGGDGDWAMTHGWFERVDGVKVYPIFNGWHGSKTTPRPTHVGWYVTWQGARLGRVPVCGPYAVIRACDAKWSTGEPMTGRMALLMGGLESWKDTMKPVPIPPAKIKNPIAVVGSNVLIPISSVLRILAGQENCDGEPYDEMMAAAERLDWLEAEVKRLQEKRG